MTGYTEHEAKRKRCPLLHNGNAMCLGSSCMAWAWDNDGYEYDYHVKTKPASSGYGYDPDNEANKKFEQAGWLLDAQQVRVSAGFTTQYRWKRARPSAEHTGQCLYLTGRIAEINGP